MTGPDARPDLPGGPLPQLDAMLRESGLDDAGLGAALGQALAPLVPTGSTGPAPSPALALLLRVAPEAPVAPRAGAPAVGDDAADAPVTPGGVPSTSAPGGAAVVPLALRGRRALAGALVLAVSGVGATGLSAAANTLPPAIQRHVSDFSRHHLPFTFPQPPQRRVQDPPLSATRLPGTLLPRGQTDPADQHDAPDAAAEEQGARTADALVAPTSGRHAAADPDERHVVGTWAAPASGRGGAVQHDGQTGRGGQTGQTGRAGEGGQTSASGPSGSAGSAQPGRSPQASSDAKPGRGQTTPASTQGGSGQGGSGTSGSAAGPRSGSGGGSAGSDSTGGEGGKGGKGGGRGDDETPSTPVVLHAPAPLEDPGAVAVPATQAWHGGGPGKPGGPSGPGGPSKDAQGGKADKDSKDGSSGKGGQDVKNAKGGRDGTETAGDAVAPADPVAGTVGRVADEVATVLD